ncbi:MAG: hypothetical protein AAGB93_11235 [Planctomycetota bacterium]
MTDAEQQLLLDLIAGEWARLSDASRPPRMWVLRHASVPLDGERVDAAVRASPPKRAWMLIDGRCEPRPLSDFARFAAVHWTRPWSGAMVPPANAIHDKGRHEIGVARFAAVRGTPTFYVEWTFAGLNGRGFLVEPDAAGELQTAELLWLS